MKSYIVVRLVILALVLTVTVDRLDSQVLGLAENPRNLELLRRYASIYGFPPAPLMSYNNADKRSLYILLDSLSLKNLHQSEEQDISFLRNEFSDVVYLLQDSLEENSSYAKPKQIYRNPNQFFEYASKAFYLRINPVLELSGGNDSKSQGDIFQNTRGIKISGIIDKKLSFFTAVYENQRGYPNYIERRISESMAIPGQGFYRKYATSLLGGLTGWDYLNAESNIGFNFSKSVQFRLGHGKHKIGDGIRSLLLSDFAHNYFYMDFSTQIGNFSYRNLFAELSAGSHLDKPGNTAIAKKYVAAHFLSLQLSHKLRIGLFESVIFARDQGFEFQYLNPIIFYRAVESQIDSPDNVLLGSTFLYRPLPGLDLYGQLAVDELKLAEIFKNRGWWGNKIGWQLGLNYYNSFGLRNLDLQLEFNAVRPYTYAHNVRTESHVLANYSHYNQPLAHPYGSNFRETIVHFKYKLIDKLFISNYLLFARKGEDPEEQNFGSDILKNYDNRWSDFGNEIGQGLHSDIHMNISRISWMFRPNYFLEMIYTYRSQHSDSAERSQNTNLWTIGLRINPQSTDEIF